MLDGIPYRTKTTALETRITSNHTSVARSVGNNLILIKELDIARLNLTRQAWVSTLKKMGRNRSEQHVGYKRILNGSTWLYWENQKVIKNLSNASRKKFKIAIRRVLEPLQKRVFCGCK